MTTAIEADGLTKRYGRTVAVDGLSFRVEAGRVTGFVGPNGAGKSTTMRLILGLDASDSGAGTDRRASATANCRAPLREVGALLDAGATHPGRRARKPSSLAREEQPPPGRAAWTRFSSSSASPTPGASVRVASPSGWRNGSVSLQPCSATRRCSCSTSPINGLDPDGIRWIRVIPAVARRRGADRVRVESPDERARGTSRTSSSSSDSGRLIAQASVSELLVVADRTDASTCGRPQVTEVMAVLAAAGGTVTSSDSDALVVTGLEPERIADSSLPSAGSGCTSSTAQRASLEDAFIDLTRDAVEYVAEHPGRRGS